MSNGMFACFDHMGVSDQVRVVRDGDYFKSEDEEFLVYLPVGDDESRASVKRSQDDHLENVRTSRNEANFLDIALVLYAGEEIKRKEAERMRNQALAAHLQAVFNERDMNGAYPNDWRAVAKAAREFIAAEDKVDADE